MERVENALCQQPSKGLSFAIHTCGATFKYATSIRTNAGTLPRDIHKPGFNNGWNNSLYPLDNPIPFCRNSNNWAKI